MRQLFRTAAGLAQQVCLQSFTIVSAPRPLAFLVVASTDACVVFLEAFNVQLTPAWSSRQVQQTECVEMSERYRATLRSVPVFGKAVPAQPPLQTPVVRSPPPSLCASLVDREELLYRVRHRLGCTWPVGWDRNCNRALAASF